jgi:hypothetical protein
VILSSAPKRGARRITVLHVLLWAAFAIWGYVFRNVADCAHMRVTIQMFLGEPDAMGAYEITTLVKEWSK